MYEMMEVASDENSSPIVSDPYPDSDSGSGSGAGSESTWSKRGSEASCAAGGVSSCSVALEVCTGFKYESVYVSPSHLRPVVEVGDEWMALTVIVTVFVSISGAGTRVSASTAFLLSSCISKRMFTTWPSSEMYSIKGSSAMSREEAPRAVRLTRECCEFCIRLGCAIVKLCSENGRTLTAQLLFASIG